MKRVALAALCLLTVACASRAVVRLPAEGRRLAASGPVERGLQQGEWTYLHDDGTPESRGEFIDDRRVGTWTYWYPDGALRMRGAWSEDRQEGRWEFRHPDGSPMCAGDYREGREHGEWTFRHPEGAVRQRGVFERGRRVLEWGEYDERGALRARGVYLDDRPVGRWTRIDDGVESVVEYAFPAGFAYEREDDPSGARREGFTRDGERAGPWVVRHADGSLRALVRFEGGTPVGELHVFGAGGERIAYGPVEGTRLTGSWHVREGGAWRSERPSPRPPWDRAFVTAPGMAMSPMESAGRALDELLAPLAPRPLPSPVDPDASGPAAPLERLEPPVDLGHFTAWERANLPAIERFYRDGQLDPSLRADQRYVPVGPGRGLGRGDPGAVRARVGRPVPTTPLHAPDGSTFGLDELRGRSVLLLVMRGFNSLVCVYCYAQTQALAPVVPRLNALGCEIVVLFPGSRSKLEEFTRAFEAEFGAEPPPWRLAYDPDLAFVHAFGLEGNLARPSAFAIGADGIVREAYVAEKGSDADRLPATELVRWIEGLR